MAGSPVVARLVRQVSPERYWQLRHLVSEALRIRDQAALAHQAHLAAQTKVDTFLRAMGLDPTQVYGFNDETQQLTPMPPPSAPVAADQAVGARSPLSMLEDS